MPWQVHACLKCWHELSGPSAHSSAPARLEVQGVESSLCCAVQQPLSAPARKRSTLPMLATMPELAAQWDTAKNPGLDPSTVSLGSDQKVWWRCVACPCGEAHTWEARICERALRHHGCPICSAGNGHCSCSTLATLRPEIAAQWDHSANAGLTPSDVPVASSKRAQWVCTKHEPAATWSTVIAARTRQHRPTGCPACAKAARLGSARGVHAQCSHACLMCLSPEHQLVLLIRVLRVLRHRLY